MPTLPTCLTADIVIRTPNRICRNRLYYSVATPPTTIAHLNSAADIIRASVGVKYIPLLSEQCGLVAVQTEYYAPDSELQGDSTDGDTDGSGEGDPFPDEVCLEIQRRTGRRGRENRGRIFISGIAEAHAGAGRLVGAIEVPAQALADSMKLVLNGAPASVGAMTPKHWDRKNNTLETVTDCRAMDVLVSRRDRRRPLVPLPVGF